MRDNSGDVVWLDGWSAKRMVEECRKTRGKVWGFKAPSAFTPEDLGLGSVVRRKSTACLPVPCTVGAVHLALSPAHNYVSGSWSPSYYGWLLTTVYLGIMRAAGTQDSWVESAKYYGKQYKLIAEIPVGSSLRRYNTRGEVLAALLWMEDEAV